MLYEPCCPSQRRLLGDHGDDDVIGGMDKAYWCTVVSTKTSDLVARLCYWHSGTGPGQPRCQEPCMHIMANPH